MITQKIQKTSDLMLTNDYSIFVSKFDNRDVNSDHRQRDLKRLERSMSDYGYLKSFPIMTHKKGNKYEVIDGQGRLHIASKLGLPVYFVVCEDFQGETSSIQDTSCKWRIEDYVHSQIAKGDKDCAEILLWSKKNKLSLNMSASLLMGHGASSGNAAGKITSGTYRITNTQYANRVSQCVMRISTIVDFAYHRNFIHAISQLCWLSYFDESQLFDRMSANKSLCCHCSSVDQYVEMIEKVYNMRSRERRFISYDLKIKMTERKESFVKGVT